jgi:hypothetical protein
MSTRSVICRVGVLHLNQEILEKQRRTMKTSLLFQSPVFVRTDKSTLPPSEEIDVDAEIRQRWRNDRKLHDLVELAYALGVGEIILANRDIDENDDGILLGQYFYARDSRDIQEKLRPWNLSRIQLATINRTLSSDRDVILLAYESCDNFAATLAHEIGHCINHRLRGISFFEFGLDPEFSRVTQNMRRVARFAEYFFQNKDEYYAEIWSRFLCGGNNRTLFRYLNRPLSRLRMKHPQKARLIEQSRSEAIGS